MIKNITDNTKTIKGPGGTFKNKAIKKPNNVAPIEKIILNLTISRGLRLIIFAAAAGRIKIEEINKTPTIFILKNTTKVLRRIKKNLILLTATASNRAKVGSMISNNNEDQ